MISEFYENLSHSRWNCKCHVVFVPKRRRRVLFGHVRRHLGDVFRALAKQKECLTLRFLSSSRAKREVATAANLIALGMDSPR